MRIFPRGIASLTFAFAAVPMIPAPTPGGWSPQNPSSAGVRQAAGFASAALSQEFGHPYIVEHIAHAESQVVEGVDYRLRFRIAELQDEILGNRKDCTVVVWSRPWLAPASVLTSFDCQNVDTAD